MITCLPFRKKYKRKQKVTNIKEDKKKTDCTGEFKSQEVAQRQKQCN